MTNKTEKCPKCHSNENVNYQSCKCAMCLPWNCKKCDYEFYGYWCEDCNSNTIDCDCFKEKI